MSQPPAPLIRVIGQVHLIYLCLLPALATFSLLYMYGHPAVILLFLGGTAAVSVYIAVVASYTPVPNSLAWAIIILLDGPLWALLSLLSKSVTPMAFAIEGFLVDGTAIWISILVLALHSYKPTKGQRIATVAIMVIALVVIGSMVWPYFRDALVGNWLSIGMLSAGVIESSIVRYKVLDKDELLRDTDTSAVYIVIFIFAWLIAMGVGNVLYETSVK